MRKSPMVGLHCLAELSWARRSETLRPQLGLGGWGRALTAPTCGDVWSQASGSVIFTLLLKKWDRPCVSPVGCEGLCPEEPEASFLFCRHQSVSKTGRNLPLIATGARFNTF